MIRNIRRNLQADPTTILNVWKNCFNKLFNVYTDEQREELEVHTAELWIP